ncbi:MAG: protoporphyrinogen oxidase [Brooklawnia sp.]|uniref:protoporphyrinogen oxidase n=1 Tax=Brooklawnia sp. TaxID=2699740 RepID=UPI003C73F1EE
MRVAVVGAGMAGLSAAVDLLDAGAEVTLIEAAPTAGGKVQTEHVDGFTIEHGPDSFVSYRPAAAELARRFGLGEQIIQVTEPRVVYLRSADRMVPLPEGMGLVLPTRLGPFVRTRLFSWPQKLRAGLDLILPRYLGDDDVAIGEFLRHRLGQAVIERLADPLIGGIYGTSIEELSLDSVLPILRSHERNSRSLILASLKSGRTTGSGGSPFRTLRGGLADLVDAVTVHLRAQPGYRERFGVAAADCSTHDGASRLRLDTGEVIESDAVILATPAPVAAGLVAGELPGAAAALRTIPHASTAVVTLGYPADAFPSPPVGHGFLDAGSGSPSSGCTISSGKWVGRAPEGSVLIRSFLPERAHALQQRADAEVFAVIEQDVADTFGVRGEPCVRRIARWDDRMPKYVVGHKHRLNAIHAALSTRPQWQLAGASYRGVGLPDVVTSGKAAAAAVLDQFGR